jgi:formylmethanofuran dehydrogenase subunit E
MCVTLVYNYECHPKYNWEEFEGYSAYTKKQAGLDVEPYPVFHYRNGSCKVSMKQNIRMKRCEKCQAVEYEKEQKKKKGKALGKSGLRRRRSEVYAG